MEVQYLESSMSNELLCKYPDTSGFGFDYSQSSIWSPLVPRFHSLACLNPKSPGLSKRKLSFDRVSYSSSVKKKSCSFGLNLNVKLQMKLKKKMKMLKCENNPPQIQSPPKKGWKKVLKMKSKQFKRKKDHYGHHHPISRVTLADYLKSEDY